MFNILFTKNIILLQDAGSINSNITTLVRNMLIKFAAELVLAIIKTFSHLL